MAPAWLNNDYLWRVQRTCKECGKQYCERENTAAWQCHYHPGEFVRDYYQADNPSNYAIGTWTCCGRGSGGFNKGCTACDHDDGEYPKDKKIFWKDGIKPLELPDTTQQRLWEQQTDFHPVFFRPGFRKEVGENYKLMPFDEEATNQRKKFGFQKYVKFGLKTNERLEVLQLELTDDKGKAQLDLSTSALYGKPRLELHELHELLLSYDHGKTYNFVDIASGKTIENATLSVVLQHVLRHRERSPDPRIAYYSQE